MSVKLCAVFCSFTGFSVENFWEWLISWQYKHFINELLFNKSVFPNCVPMSLLYQWSNACFVAWPNLHQIKTTVWKSLFNRICFFGIIIQIFSGKTPEFENLVIILRIYELNLVILVDSKRDYWILTFGLKRECFIVFMRFRKTITDHSIDRMVLLLSIFKRLTFSSRIVS